MKAIMPAYMFAGTGIVDAVIPASVTYLEADGVFANCADLETVTFQAATLTYTYLGNYLFYNCDSLVDIVIPNGNSTNPFNSKIGYTFAECDNLETVTVYYKAGSGSSGGITIVAATNPTAGHMFENCKSLKDLILYDTTSPITDEDGEGEAPDPGVTPPPGGGIIGPGLGGLSTGGSQGGIMTAGLDLGGIGAGGSAGGIGGIGGGGIGGIGGGTTDPEEGDTTEDTKYKRVYLHYVGAYFFAGCTSLESFTVMPEAYIGEYAFAGCIALKEFTFYVPEEEEEDGEDDGDEGGTPGGGGIVIGPGFGGLSAGGSQGGIMTAGLGGIVIGPPNPPVDEPEEEETEEITRLKFLGKYAFAGCTTLTEITLPGLPDKVGSNVFDGWTSNQTINLSDNAEDIADQIEYGMFEGCDATVLDKDGDDVDTDN